MENADVIELQGSGYRLILIGFDPECVSKGFFCNATLETEGGKYRISFYDKVRLSQDIENELISYGVFSEPNIVVVPEISPNHFLSAIDYILKFKDLPSRFTDIPSDRVR